VNLSEAAKSHQAWRSTLTSYLVNPNQSLDPADLASGTKCALGQWLIARSHKYSARPDFSRVLAEHARFHRAAADLVRRADSGQSVVDEIAPGANSEFVNASSALVEALLAMGDLA